ncbi:MAG: hypothetical protein LUD46_17670, partial [Parabacteroides sp.]|nr:hypothetical protein [Parabacteroides sp.]
NIHMMFNKSTDIMRIIINENLESGTKIHLGGRSSNIFLIYPEGGIQKSSQAVITVTNEAGHKIAK